MAIMQGKMGPATVRTARWPTRARPRVRANHKLKPLSSIKMISSLCPCAWTSHSAYSRRASLTSSLLRLAATVSIFFSPINWPWSMKRFCWLCCRTPVAYRGVLPAILCWFVSECTRHEPLRWWRTSGPYHHPSSDCVRHHDDVQLVRIQCGVEWWTRQFHEPLQALLPHLHNLHRRCGHRLSVILFQEKYDCVALYM